MQQNILLMIKNIGYGTNKHWTVYPQMQIFQNQQTMIGTKYTTYPIGEGTASGLTNEGAFLIYKKDGTANIPTIVRTQCPIRKQI